MTAPIDSVRKFRQLSWPDRVLLTEATLLLAAAAAAIAVLPLRLVGRLAARPVRRQQPSPQARLIEATRVRWAVTAAARRVPWRAKCFEQGLASQIMLRRRG